MEAEIPDADLPEHLRVLPDVFIFVSSYVLPTLELHHITSKLEFDVRDASEFNAGIQCCDDEKIVVFLNRGAVTRVFDRCCCLVENFQETLQDKDAQHTVALIYTATLVFLLLHEIVHFVAGHIGYLREHFPEEFGQFLGYAELPTESDATEAFLAFRKMSELEADGSAFALTLDFGEDIAASIGIVLEDQLSVRQAMIHGCFLGISFIEGLFDNNEVSSSEYPFVASRLLNICSQYLRVVCPSAVGLKDGSFKFLGMEEKKARELGSIYVKTVVPALQAVHDELIARNGNSEIFSENSNSHQDTAFLKDVRAALAGGRPINSQYGQSLFSLSQSRASFMANLETYRMSDLWPSG